jgi:hypothetical protein
MTLSMSNLQSQYLSLKDKDNKLQHLCQQQNKGSTDTFELYYADSKEDVLSPVRGGINSKFDILNTNTHNAIQVEDCKDSDIKDAAAAAAPIENLSQDNEELALVEKNMLQLRRKACRKINRVLKANYETLCESDSQDLALYLEGRIYSCFSSDKNNPIHISKYINQIKILKARIEQKEISLEQIYKLAVQSL